jgi:voltage-gated potassium channel Kch
VQKQPSLRQRWQYFFDNMMARGASAMIGMLAALSLVVILVSALLVTLGGRLLAPEGADGVSFLEALWLSLMRTMDAGTMGGDAGWGFRLVMFVLPTLGGVFIISSLIGVLSNVVQSKMEDLRKGRSLVLEHDHSVILGWSPQVFTLIAELVEANSNRKNACIAILADKDKVEMEDEIRSRIPGTRNTRLICRSGSPIDPTDLELIGPHTARSIIVVPPEGDGADTFVIKTVLAITNNPHRHPGPYNIVTQLNEGRNRQVTDMLGKNDHLIAVMSCDIIARVTAQTSRQSGLSLVYTELFNFGGDEVYFKEEPALVGSTFGEALPCFADSAVIGLVRADGTTQVNPPMDSRIAAGDKLICISADDDTILMSGTNALSIQNSAIRSGLSVPAPAPESVLMLGWNDQADTVMRELSSYVARGSSATVVAPAAFTQHVAALGELGNMSVIFRLGDATDRALLDELKIVDFDHVIVLADKRLPVQDADARTLVTLLHLRDISLRDETPFSIVSEMLDLRNRELATVTRVNDFIVSTHMISLMMAQLSENPALMPVFIDMLDPEGSEIYLKPAEGYVAAGAPVNFYTLLEAARRRGETAIGYRIVSEQDDETRSFGVHINPRKGNEITFQPGDKVIVFAE